MDVVARAESEVSDVRASSTLHYTKVKVFYKWAYFPIKLFLVADLKVLIWITFETFWCISDITDKQADVILMIGALNHMTLQWSVLGMTNNLFHLVCWLHWISHFVNGNTHINFLLTVLKWKVVFSLFVINETNQIPTWVGHFAGHGSEPLKSRVYCLQYIETILPHVCPSSVS